VFDVAVIGGGITGCMSAYFCKKAGLRVVLYEKEGIAAGASGAAGAFISPRIGKGGALQQLTNEAFTFAVEFYKQNFPHLFLQCGVERIAKDEEDAKNYDLYAKKLDIEHQKTLFDKQKSLFFPQGGIVDAKAMCEALVEGVEVVKADVTLSKVQAKHIIIATGDQKALLDTNYFGLRKIWGLRIDVRSDTIIKHALHKNISISASVDGVVKIGATHQRDVDNEQLLRKKGIDYLVKEAKKLAKLENVTYLNCFCGTRSAVRDYFPIAGKIVDVQRTLGKYEMIKKGIKPRDGLIYHPNIYAIGGTGGRGFVFSPYIAKELVELIAKQKAVDERINPDRLFYKWARRLY